MKTAQVIDMFGEMMISRMEQMKSKEWTQGWLGTSFGGSPMNLSGRHYSGLNSFMLYMAAEINGYSYPVYFTYNQMRKYGALVNKGEKSMPVLFWSIVYKDKNGVEISEDDWKKLSNNGKLECNTYPILRSYNVFNIAQTNLEEVAPEVVSKLKEKYKVGEIPADDEGMYQNPRIDNMLESQSWVCPITYANVANNACYRPAKDDITIPTKRQFKVGNNEDEVYFSGQQYYSTLIHEMAHSTGHKTRLNRFNVSGRTDKDYAREELVAELTAALVGQNLGFDYRIIDSNACYLDWWISKLKQEPRFIVSVLSDVNRAANMIMEHVEPNEEKA